MKLAVQIVCVLLSLGVTLCSGSQSLYQLMGYSRRSSECGRNTACRWAVCEWSRNLRVNSDFCDFIPGSCNCPSGTTCQLTDVVDPDAKFLAFYFRCRPAGSFFPDVMSQKKH